MKTCLLVIDAQESFRQRPYFTAHDLSDYLAAQNALINGCIAKNIPVVRIFHVDGPLETSNPFAIESGHVKPLAELRGYTPAATFYKSRHSALVGTGLSDWLRPNGTTSNLSLEGGTWGSRIEATTTCRPDFTRYVFRSYLLPYLLGYRHILHLKLSEYSL